MSDHEAIKTIVRRVHTDDIGGAADTAIEVIQAMAELVKDSSAGNAEALAAEVLEAATDIMRVMPSLAAPCLSSALIVRSPSGGVALGRLRIGPHWRWRRNGQRVGR